MCPVINVSSFTPACGGLTLQHDQDASSCNFNIHGEWSTVVFWLFVGFVGLCIPASSYKGEKSFLSLSLELVLLTCLLGSAQSLLRWPWAVLAEVSWELWFNLTLTGQWQMLQCCLAEMEFLLEKSESAGRAGLEAGGWQRAPCAGSRRDTVPTAGWVIGMCQLGGERQAVLRGMSWGSQHHCQLSGDTQGWPGIPEGSGCCGGLKEYPPGLRRSRVGVGGTGQGAPEGSWAAGTGTLLCLLRGCFGEGCWGQGELQEAVQHSWSCCSIPGAALCVRVSLHPLSCISLTRGPTEIHWELQVCLWAQGQQFKIKQIK